jgi:SAM-dependent methyltransferase
VRTDELERLADFEEWYWWHRGRRSIVCRLLERFAPPRARILDVGCGTGATTAALRPFGSVSGVDTGLAGLRHARAHGLAVARGSAEKLPVGDAKLDVAVALDVLEHLDDDRRALAEILRVLRPGGVLLATVPAYPFLWSSHDEALDHRRRYRRGELRERLLAAGFEITLCSHVMASILPPVMAVRLTERWWRRRAPATSGYLTLPRPMNDLLARLVSLGGYLVPFLTLPFGLSIVAVARKPAPRAPSADGIQSDRTRR